MLLVCDPPDAPDRPVVAPLATDPTPDAVPVTRLETVCASACAANVKQMNVIPTVTLFVCCST
jgi:hypothetical protein